MKTLLLILSTALLIGCSKEKLPTQVISFDTKWLNTHSEYPNIYIRFFRGTDGNGQKTELFHSEEIISHFVTNGWTMLPAGDGLLTFRRESTNTLPVYEKVQTN